MSRPKNKLPIQDLSLSSLPLEQFMIELRKLKSNASNPIVDGSVCTTENGYIADIQRGQEKIREKCKQELLTILKPLNELTAQTIVTFSIKEINAVGRTLSIFKDRLEINLHGFMVNAFAAAQKKLQQLLSTTPNLPQKNRLALQDMITYLKIKPSSLQCRIERKFKFFTPTKVNSLMEKEKISRMQQYNSPHLSELPSSQRTLQPVNLFAADEARIELSQASSINGIESAATTSRISQLQFSRAYFERKHALDRPSSTTVAAVQSTSRANTNNSSGTILKQPSPIKRIQTATIVLEDVNLHSNTSIGTPKLFNKSSFKISSPQKMKQGSFTANPKLVKQLQEKNDEIQHLQKELQDLRAKKIELEDNLLKNSKARSKDQVELQTYSNRELDFISRELAVHSKNAELGKTILRLEQRVLELEQQLRTEALSNSHLVSNKDSQLPQGVGAAAAAPQAQSAPVQNFAQLVFVQQHHHHNTVNLVQTANIAHFSQQAAADPEDSRASTLNNKLSASANKSCSQF